MFTDNDAQLWQNPPYDLHVPTREVHVWLATLDLAPVLVEHYAQCLSEEEKRKAGHFRFMRDQRRFIVSHSILRQLLGRYLHAEPSAINFELGMYGKPFLAANEQVGPQKLSFNMSHAHEVAVYAFSMQGEVGIDVEYMRPMPDLLAIAHRLFSVEALRNLQSLTGEMQQRQFFRYWTRMEAYLKARGVGFSGAEQEDVRNAAVDEYVVDQMGTRWKVCDMPRIIQYRASLVLSQPEQPVLYWQWNV